MIRQHNKIARLIIVFLITSLILSSCTSGKLLRSEYSSDTEKTRAFITKNLHPGDRVRIITTDGRQLKFKVQKIDSQAIIGDKQQVAFSEIARLEKSQFNAGKTMVLVVIMGTIAVAVLFTIWLNIIFD